MDMDMGGMGMGGGDSGAQCVISMLWNWNTVDACFIARSWHIRSRGMFAGSCVGVICLVIVLEFLRRIAREYDAFIIHRAQMRAQYLAPSVQTHAGPDSTAPASESHSAIGISNNGTRAQKTTANTKSAPEAAPRAGSAAPFRVRPSIIEQVIRALLHMLQFAVAYFVMLLAMYFNGYIIICIFIGAFLGSFIFSWEYIGGEVKEYVTLVALVALFFPAFSLASDQTHRARCETRRLRNEFKSRH
ncbi:Ctr copper transporter family-domain-containing protein [Aspergillus navahoensis]